MSVEYGGLVDPDQVEHRFVADDKCDGAVDVGRGIRMLIVKPEHRDEWGHYLMEHAHRLTYQDTGRTELVIVAPRITQHTIESHDPLTITPSLLCVSCGLHGYVTDGTWKKA